MVQNLLTQHRTSCKWRVVRVVFPSFAQIAVHASDMRDCTRDDIQGHETNSVDPSFHLDWCVVTIAATCPGHMEAGGQPKYLMKSAVVNHGACARKVLPDCGAVEVRCSHSGKL